MADSTHPYRTERFGFTLVELLVVIGIIALLISVLLPSLNRARQQANNLRCLSNLRQIGVGFSLYAADNKGAWPRPAGGGSRQGSPAYAAATGWAPRKAWHKDLIYPLIYRTGYKAYNVATGKYDREPSTFNRPSGWPAIDSIVGPDPYGDDPNYGWAVNTIFECPSARTLDPDGTDASLRTYGMNARINKQVNVAGETRGAFKQSYAVRNNSKAMLVTDNTMPWTGVWDGDGDFSNSPGNQPKWNDQPGAWRKTLKRHNNSLNTLFCDGHAEPLKEAEVPTAFNAAGTTKVDKNITDQNFFRFWYGTVP